MKPHLPWILTLSACAALAAGELAPPATAPADTATDTDDVSATDSDGPPASDTDDPAFLAWCQGELDRIRLGAGPIDSDWRPLDDGGELEVYSAQPGPGIIEVTFVDYPVPPGTARIDFPWVQELIVHDVIGGRTLRRNPGPVASTASGGRSGPLWYVPEGVPLHPGQTAYARLCDVRFAVEYTFSHPTVTACARRIWITDLKPKMTGGMFPPDACPTWVDGPPPQPAVDTGPIP